MKVNITIKGPVLNGYLNLDPSATLQDNDRILCNPNDLSPLIDANEIDEEFLINDLLDYLPIQARQQILTHFLTRVAHGGVVVITGLCFQEFCRLVHNGQLNLEQANILAYGIGKKSFAHPDMNIQIALATQQFDLDKVSYSGHNYVIVLRRK